MRSFRLALIALCCFPSAGFAAGDDPCAGKKYCAFVYVTPWCPVCKEHEPEIRGYLDHNGKVSDAGFRAVVGQGRKPGDNAALAKSFGHGSIADDQGEWQRKLNAFGFPTYYVRDQSGKVVYRGPEAAEFVRKKFR